MRVTGDPPALLCAAAMTGKSREVGLPAMYRFHWESVPTAVTSLTPDPLTVLYHCRTGARIESALRFVPANASSKTTNGSSRITCCALLHLLVGQCFAA